MQIRKQQSGSGGLEAVKKSEMIQENENENKGGRYEKNPIRRHQPEKSGPAQGQGDLTVLVCCAVLLLLGVLMAGSIANREAFNSFRDAVMTVVKQLIFAGAFFLMYGLAEKLFSWKVFSIAVIPLLLVYFGLMAVVQVAGVDNYGARSWISLGFFTLQPSELFKPLIIALSGWSVHRCRKRLLRPKKALRTCCGCSGCRC